MTLTLSACHTPYHITHISGGQIAVDKRWDAHPDSRMTATLAPYKNKVDSLMSSVVGKTIAPLTSERPESPLSNLVADVLRQAAAETLGRPADMGLVNMGGIRSSLPQGALTTAHIYEILPFENSLCIITLQGKDLQTLLEQIAAVKGEGVSGVKMTITAEGELKSATIGGKAIRPESLYTLATVDYLADGNDRMTACLQAVKRISPANATLRDLFMEYVKRQTAAGKPVTARTEGRITIDK